MIKHLQITPSVAETPFLTVIPEYRKIDESYVYGETTRFRCHSGGSETTDRISSQTSTNFFNSAFSSLLFL